MHIYLFIHECTYISILFTFTYICIHVNVKICQNIHTCIYICMYMCTHIYAYLYAYISLHMFPYMYVCVYIYRYIRIDIYTRMAVLHFAVCCSVLQCVAVCCSPWSDNVDRFSHVHIRAHTHAACKRSDQVCRGCQGLQILHSGWSMHAYRVAKTHRMPYHFPQKSRIGHLTQKSSRIVGSFLKRDLLLGALQAEGLSPRILRAPRGSDHWLWACVFLIFLHFFLRSDISSFWNRTSLQVSCLISNRESVFVRRPISHRACISWRLWHRDVKTHRMPYHSADPTDLTSGVYFLTSLCFRCPIRDRTSFWDFRSEIGRLGRLGRPISKKGVKEGQEVVVWSVGSAVRLLGHATGSGAKAPPLAARPVAGLFSKKSQ